MKVAISAAGRDLESLIDERFGRCRYFIIVETADMGFEAVENTYADLPTGAGIQAASLLASKGVGTILTGNCGPNAMRVFAQTNIRIVSGQHGLIKDALVPFKNGLPKALSSANIPNKSGASSTTPDQEFRHREMNIAGGRGMGGGRGLGGGRGMGGCGRGMGMGGGAGMGRRRGTAGSIGSQNTPGLLPEREELAQLQKRVDALRKQIET